ncbi:MAG: heavy-metal-associated domain-containing protein [Pseudomonadota bacterium]
MVMAVENIKCGGCANSIKQKLNALPGVVQTTVDIEAGSVAVNFDADIDQLQAIGAVEDKLAAMGYPKVGSVEGLKAAGAKAKSFVSCAVGSMSDSK